MNQEHRYRGLLAYGACFVGVCGHASSEFVSKLTGVIGPELSVWRFMIGGVGLLVVCALVPSARDLLSPLRQDWRRIVPLAWFGMAAGQLVFHWSLDFASVIQVATMVTAMPIIVVFIERLINGTPVTAPKLISGFGAFGGVLFLLTDGYLLQLAGDGGALTGVAMAFLCALIGAFYIVLAKPLIVTYGPLRMTTYTFALGSLFLYPLVGFFWGVWIDPLTIFERPPGEAAAILTIGFWNTTIAMIFWLGGLAFAPDMARANYLFFLKPVIAAFLAIAILGDPLSLLQFLAIAAICLCVAAEFLWDRIRPLSRRP